MKAICTTKPRMKRTIKRDLFGELSEGVVALADARLATQEYLEELSDAKAAKRALAKGVKSIS